MERTAGTLQSYSRVMTLDCLSAVCPFDRISLIHSQDIEQKQNSDNN